MKLGQIFWKAEPGKLVVEETPLAPSTPPVEPTRFVSDDFKTSIKSLRFELKNKESRAVFVGMVDELHQQGVIFTLRQEQTSFVVWMDL